MAGLAPHACEGGGASSNLPLRGPLIAESSVPVWQEAILQTTPRNLQHPEPTSVNGFGRNEAQTRK